MGVHFRLTLLALAVMVSLGVITTAALAQDEESQPPVPEAFFAAKAAAGGVLDLALTVQAVELTKANMHAVQLSIERYNVDSNGAGYPQHINQLVLGDSAYAEPGFYANPFSAASAEARDAVEVPFGWTPAAPGNFTYLQIYDEKGNVTGYMLLGYGADRESGQDVDGDGQPDGVVISLASSMKPFPTGLTTFLSGGREVKIDMGE